MNRRSQILLMIGVFIFILLENKDVSISQSKDPIQENVGTQTCIGCHQGWFDNNPPIEDTVAKNVSKDYLPINLFFPEKKGSFLYNT